MGAFNPHTILGEVTAILLAGGKSKRMGSEKAFLQVHGVPLIQYVYNQLHPVFKGIIISTNTKKNFSFLGVEVVEDREQGKGPLMGIATGLEASPSMINFVVACDIPEINLPFIAEMVRQSRGYDGVIPVNNKSQYEPLYGIYTKNMLPKMKSLLSSGICRISKVFAACHIHFIPVHDTPWLWNLNTKKDYENYIKDHTSRQVKGKTGENPGLEK